MSAHMAPGQKGTQLLLSYTRSNCRINQDNEQIYSSFIHRVGQKILKHHIVKFKLCEKSLLNCGMVQCHLWSKSKTSEIDVTFLIMFVHPGIVICESTVYRYQAEHRGSVRGPPHPRVEQRPRGGLAVPHSVQVWGPGGPQGARWLFPLCHQACQIRVGCRIPVF